MTEIAIYDGRTAVGCIIRTPAGIIAKDAAGRKVGVFKSTADAVRAVFAARDRLSKPRCATS
ncbi:hypothetical protein [Methylocella sp.]|jgi:hypothetical protein|uniref:hypothetical protein n=1 Tax=Methylocella sp. TaxID=1978226 RepID=UPI003C26D533